MSLFSGIGSFFSDALDFTTGAFDTATDFLDTNTDFLGGNSGVADILSLAGSIYGYNEQKQASKDAEKLGERNAAISKVNTDYAVYVQQLRTERLKASQRATYGASGVRSSEGSALTVLADTIIKSNTDLNRIRQGGSAQIVADLYQGKSTSDALRANSTRTLIGGVAGFLDIR